MSNEFRFANTFWSYGAQECEFDEDLEDLVSMAIRREDDGQGTEGEFWEMVGDSWEEVNVEAVKLELRRRERERERLRAQSKKATPWRVWIFGPEGLAQWWSSHETKEEADAKAASLPGALKATVSNGASRVRRPSE